MRTGDTAENFNGTCHSPPPPVITSMQIRLVDLPLPLLNLPLALFMNILNHENEPTRIRSTPEKDFAVSRSTTSGNHPLGRVKLPGVPRHSPRVLQLTVKRIVRKGTDAETM
jgi:hypothetical protein